MFCAQACRLQVMLHEEIAKGAIASVWPGRGAWSGTGVVTYVKSAMLRSLAGDASAPAPVATFLKCCPCAALLDCPW